MYRFREDRYLGTGSGLVAVHKNLGSRVAGRGADGAERGLHSAS
jgi:hypothetical protein